jgi:hypothetical protein
MRLQGNAPVGGKINAEMASERQISVSRLATRSAQQDELLASLRATVEALTTCVERLHELIEKVSAAIPVEDPVAGIEEPRRDRRTRISYGGGPSPLAPREVPREAQSAGDHWPSDQWSSESAPATAGRHSAAGRAQQTPESHSRALVVATELAHLGYTPEEIAERLRARWGEPAAEILRDVLE